MFRSENEVTAENLAENFYKEFAPFEYEWDLDEFQILDPPNRNARVGRVWPESHDGYITVLTTSRGPIALMVINYTPPWTDDATTELELMGHFANIQLDTLYRSAIIP